MFKTKNPYKADNEVLDPVEVVDAERKQAKGKAVARYPHKPLEPFQDNHEAGKMKRPAYTPGGPSGS